MCGPWVRSMVRIQLLRMRSMFEVWLKLSGWGEHPSTRQSCPPSPDRIWNFLPPCAVHCEPLILGALPGVVACEELPGFYPHEGVQPLGSVGGGGKSLVLPRCLPEGPSLMPPPPCLPMSPDSRGRPMVAWGPYPLQDVNTNEVP